MTKSCCQNLEFSFRKSQTGYVISCCDKSYCVSIFSGEKNKTKTKTKVEQL